MDISSILNNLSEEDIKKLQETAASFFGTQSSKPEPEKNSTALSLPGISPQMLGSVAKISAALSADEAAMMIKLMGVLGSFKEGNK